MPRVEEIVQEELDDSVRDFENPAYWGPAGSGPLTALPGYERPWRDGLWKSKPRIELPFEVKMKIMKEVEKDFRVMRLPTRLWPRSWFIMAKFDELKSLLERNLYTIEPHTGIRRDWHGDTDPAKGETIPVSYTHLRAPRDS